MSTFDESKIRRDGDGKFGTKDGSREDAGQLDDAFSTDAHVERHREISDVVERMRDSGVLSEVGHGGNKASYETDNVLVGRTPGGDRVYCVIGVNHRGPGTTIDLEPTGERFGITSSFSVVPKGRRDAVSTGSYDSLDADEKAVVPSALARAGMDSRNDMTPGTAEQMKQYRDIESEERDRAASAPFSTSPLLAAALGARDHKRELYRRSRNEIETDRGHEFGRSEPLYRPLEPRVFSDALNTIATAQKKTRTR